MAVVQDVEEGETGVFVDGRSGGGVYQVPGGADVSVGDVKRFVKVF